MANSPEYLQQLQAEKDNLDSSFVNAVRLISAGKERTSIDERASKAKRRRKLNESDALAMRRPRTNKGETDSERPCYKLAYFMCN